MYCSDWKREYMTNRFLQVFPEVMKESEIPGHLLIEKAWKGKEEVTRFRYTCEDKDVALQEIYLQDRINNILAAEEALDERRETEEEVQGDDLEEDEAISVNELELIMMIREQWESIYRVSVENKEKLFQPDIVRYLVPFLANTRLNESFIDELPHIKKDSLSILFRVLVPDLMPEAGKTGIIVTGAMMKKWNMNPEQLLDKALYNPYFVRQFELLTFDEVFNGVKRQAEEEWGNMFEVKGPRLKGVFVSSKEDSYPYTAAAIYNKEICNELVACMEGEYLAVFSCAGDIQVYPIERDAEELQLDIESENEYFELTDGWISNSVFHYSKGLGLEEICVAEILGKEQEKHSRDRQR